MNRPTRSLALSFAVAAIVVPACAQERPLEFETASIKPAAPAFGVGVPRNPNAGSRIGPTSLRFGSSQLIMLICNAFEMDPVNVVGPEKALVSWWEVEANYPTGADKARYPEMLRSLLASRFGLKSHFEDRDTPVFGLTIAKGGTKGLEPVPAPEPGGPPDMPYRSSIQPGGAMRFQFKRDSMAVLTKVLTQYMERSVIDETGLKGDWSFSIDMSMTDAAAARPPLGVAPLPALPASVAGEPMLRDSIKQHGFQLEPKRAPIKTLVIDYISSTPTEN